MLLITKHASSSIHDSSSDNRHVVKRHSHSRSSTGTSTSTTCMNNIFNSYDLLSSIAPRDKIIKINHIFHSIPFRHSSSSTSSSSSSSSSSPSMTVPPKSKGLPNSSLPLGHPLPLDEHACSVSLPTWSSVVGYEEGSPQITSKLACGYPRFVYHPYIIQLMNVALDIDHNLQQQYYNDHKNNSNSNNNSNNNNNYQNKANNNNQQQKWDCLVLPTRESALRCHDFLVKACGYYDGIAASPRLLSHHDAHLLNDIVGHLRIQLFSSDNAFDNSNCTKDGRSSSSSYYNAKSPIRVLDLHIQTGVHAVIFPAQTVFAIEAKSYWQHTGEVLSSRRAEVALCQLHNNLSCNESTRSTGTRSSEGGEAGNNNYATLPRVTSSFHCESNHDDDCHNGQWKKCTETNQYHLAFYPSSPCDNMGQHEESDGSENPYDGIKERIASIVGIPSSPSNVFLTPSGMSSIYAALRATRRRKMVTSENSNGGSAIVFGFPYLDTLKMCSRPEFVPDGVVFFGHGNEQDLSNLEQLLKERKENNSSDVSVLITEFPSNPLLNCPNLQKLRELADEYDFAVVVDDTIGNFANIDLIQSGLADVVCTSLTKLFNGRGDAMAGSVVTNPNTKIGQWLQKDFMKNHRDHEGLWIGDAHAINANSIDFLSRSSQINKTTEALADWLHERDEVAALYYPKFTSPEIYGSCLNKRDYEGQHKAGYGGLFSILLQPHICQRTFYDKLDLSKGPSLGTDFSLVCPYTLLAHYHELDFAMSYDVQPNLLRFAIGLEDLETLKTKFVNAFQESKLHPKLPPKSSIGSNVISRGFCTLSSANSYRRLSEDKRFENFNYGSLGHTCYAKSSIKSTMHKQWISSNSSSNLMNKFDACRLGMVRAKTCRRNVHMLRRFIKL